MQNIWCVIGNILFKGRRGAEESQGERADGQPGGEAEEGGGGAGQEGDPAAHDRRVGGETLRVYSLLRSDINVEQFYLQ